MLQCAEPSFQINLCSVVGWSPRCTLSMDGCPAEPLDLPFRCDSVSESDHLSHVFPPC